jgi:hypothetical protein
MIDAVMELKLSSEIAQMSTSFGGVLTDFAQCFSTTVSSGHQCKIQK